MQVSNAKIWKAFFFKSFVWLVMPICIFGNIKSCSSYIDAGHHLTPYSVSVRGYYRRDGTYVNPYKRRPPGGVRHDIPYEDRRFYMGLLFFVCLVGNIVSLSVYTNLSTTEISRIKKEESEIEEKRIREEKNLLLEKIIEKTDFNNLFRLPVPENLEKAFLQNASFAEKKYQGMIIIFPFLPFQMNIMFA